MYRRCTKSPFETTPLNRQRCTDKRWNTNHPQYLWLRSAAFLLFSAGMNPERPERPLSIGLALNVPMDTSVLRVPSPKLTPRANTSRFHKL